MRTNNTILVGDALSKLQTLPDNLVNTLVTSPPYYKHRDYGVEGQVGQEETPEEYIEKLVAIFQEARRVLRQDGTLWINIADTYASRSGNGYKQKDLIGIPWMLAFALRADGWYLRQDIIWNKPNAMPSPVKDRCVTSHEYLFLLSKSKKYYFDHYSIMTDAKYDGRKATLKKEGNKYELGSIQNRAHERWQVIDGVMKANKRSVWSVSTKPFAGSHAAPFPPDLIRDCIKAGSPEGGMVLDPFLGSGTTMQVAMELGRSCIGIELNPEYLSVIQERINNQI